MKVLLYLLICFSMCVGVASIAAHLLERRMTMIKWLKNAAATL